MCSRLHTTSMAAPSVANGPQVASVASSMCAKICSKPPQAVNMSTNGDSNLSPDYTSFPEHCVVSFQPDRKCVLQGNNSLKAFKISMALVLIGTTPTCVSSRARASTWVLTPQSPSLASRIPLTSIPSTLNAPRNRGCLRWAPW